MRHNKTTRVTGGDGQASGGAILAAFLANVGIAIAKFAGFAITGSSSLLAEGIHSLADSSNQGLLTLGGRRARRAPTALHPFGFGRSRYFWAFVVAVVLFSLGGLFSLYEGYHKVADPHEIESPIVAFAIFGVAFVFEASALRTAAGHARPKRGGRGWLEFVRATRDPELPVLLLEDSAALVGLLCATTGVALSVITGNPVFDGLGTIAIGLLLVTVAMLLATEMRSLLIGEAAAPRVVEAIEGELEAGPGVTRLIELLTQHLGPDELLVAAKVQFDESLSVRELTAAIDGCEARLREAVPIARFVYIEPAVAGSRLSPPRPPDR